MTAVSGIPLLILLFLVGLTTGGWATINNKVMAVLYIVVALFILIDLLYAHRATLAPVVRRRRQVG